MNTLLATLAQRDPAPFDSIVHIGCGPYAGLEDYAPLESKHLLLVEADPEAFAELAERHAGSESVTLVQALVRGGVGEATFHRYSLPMLNSPLGIGRLREIYPRLELLETLPMQATALAALLSERAPALGERNLLVLDIPGQEAAVFPSLPQAFLEKFEWILVFGASEPWHDGGEPLKKTAQALAGFFFETIDQSADDPAWPFLLLRRDSAKAEMQAELEKRASVLAANATEIHQQSEQNKDLESQLSTLVAERDELATRHQSLATERDAIKKDLETSKGAAAAAEKKHAELAAKLEKLTTERDALQAERSTFDSRLSTLSSEHSTLVSEREALSTSLAESKAELEKRASLLVEKATEIHQQSERNKDLESQNASLRTERDSLLAERSTLASRLSTLSSEHSTLVSEREALSTSLAESKAELEKRASLLVEKATEIHQQSERNKDLESQNASLRTERDALLAERSTLASRLSTLSSEHSTLATEREALSTLLDVLTKGRVAQDEQMEKMLQEKQTLVIQCDAHSARIADLEKENADLRAHTKSIDEEFGKAEGQLELIKDLFLREALR